jgi:hypothetical protein
MQLLVLDHVSFAPPISLYSCAVTTTRKGQNNNDDNQQEKETTCHTIIILTTPTIRTARIRITSATHTTCSSALFA